MLENKKDTPRNGLQTSLALIALRLATLSKAEGTRLLRPYTRSAKL